jgi:hypothetical protein
MDIKTRGTIEFWHLEASEGYADLFLNFGDFRDCLTNSTLACVTRDPDQNSTSTPGA